ncbi:type II secretion system protein N [Pseudomonas tohonis]|jgi:general secretion pathway protein C|uniref:type II secretion system protein N n=1 Tax=Pseudomonas tohonis TaxID=2725477 RepID=UPI001F462A06|nr:type II secretion system protein N [Pseudomonas tohonis]
MTLIPTLPRALPPRALHGLAALLLCAWLAWLGLGSGDYHQALRAQADTQPTRPPLPTAMQAPSLDATAIALMFGAMPPQPDAHEQEDPGMLLTLLASLRAEHPDDSRALIASPGGSAFHRPGERLPGGALLRSVEADHVLILRNGREQRLGFARPAETLLVPLAAPAPSPETTP